MSLRSLSPALLPSSPSADLRLPLLTRSIPDSPKSPAPAIIFANGTTPLNQTYLDSLPYPFPFPLLGISESINVKLGSAANAKGIILPTNEKSSEEPPFKGSQIGSWGWTW